MKNVVVKVTSEEHGAEVIQAFKNLGVDTNNHNGNNVGNYYGLFDGVFDFLRIPLSSQVITLEELKAMANSYPKMMWVWDNNPDQAHEGYVVGHLEHEGNKVFVIDDGEYYQAYKNAKDIEEPIEITLEELRTMKNPYPKVMWVWEHEGAKPKKRVVFMEKNGEYLSWVNAETLEESENYTGVTYWQYARDIIEPIEITLEQIAEKFGVNVEQIKIKK